MRNAKKSKLGKMIAIVFSILVVELLILTGPAQGFTLELGVNEDRPQLGDTITYTVDVEIDTGERLPIDELILEFAGPITIICRFDAEGVAIGGCDGITITRDQESDYSYGPGQGYYGYGYNFGYGYGYGPGTLKYTIKVDTSIFDVGTYSTRLSIKIGDQIFSTVEGVLDVLGVSTSSSSGGGGAYPVCETNWQCSEWSLCINGEQSRSCYKVADFCDADPMPDIFSQCSGGYMIEVEDNSININDDSEYSSSVGVDVEFDGPDRIVVLLIMIVLFKCFY